MHIRLCVTTMCLVAFSLSAAITVTRDSPQKFSFIFEMEDFTVAASRTGERVYSRVSFRESNCRLYDAGNVALPAQSLYVGVPWGGKARIQFVSHKVKTVVLEYPLEPDSTGLHSMENNTPSFNNPWMSTVSYVAMRRMRTAHFFIRPFLYDPETHTLRILQKGTCVIEFPSSTLLRGMSRRPEGAFYAMLEEQVLNYSTAVRWLKPQGRVSRRRLLPSVLPAGETMVRFDIGDGNVGVNECTSKENGIVKIVPDNVRPLGSPLLIQSLSLFGAERAELNDTVPRYEAIPDGAVEIPLMRVDQNNNGYFDGNDYLLAYVTGTSDWYYSSAADEYRYQYNRMVNKRHYWIRRKGGTAHILPFGCSGVPTATVSVYENPVRFKRSVYLLTDSETKGSLNWIWRRLSRSSPSFSYTLSLPDCNTQYPGYIREYRGYAKYYTLAVMFGDSVLSDATDWRPVYNWRDSVVTFTMVQPSESTYYELQSFDVRYTRNLDMAGKQTLRIYSPAEPDSGIVKYQLCNIPNTLTYIFRISSDERSVHLVDTLSGGGTAGWVDTAGIGIQYFVCAEAGLQTDIAFYTYHASNAGPTDQVITNLRDTRNASDYCIITHSEFMEAAKELAGHKKSLGRFGYPKIVDVNDIFREFSGGKGEPGAIRNFLLYASHYWTPVSAGADPGPDYVVLFGLGHYDFKNYDTQETNFVPPALIYMGSVSKCVEDYFACIDTGTIVKSTDVAPSLFLGRIPCADVINARNAVNKIIEMEGEDADRGPWRNRLLLVSDDDRQGLEKDNLDHYRGNEEIEVIVRKLRPGIEVRKVILFEYTWNELYQKPEAAAALLNEINNGVAVVNYFGHGNQSAWADEGVLNKDEVINLTNDKRYPVVNSFSCSVAYFDKPDMTSLSEVLVTLPDAGAIAAIASTRTAYATNNELMAKEFFRIFYRNGVPLTLGQAYSLTKQARNLKNYVLLGDPSLMAVHIDDSVALTVTDEQSIPTDSINALQTIFVKGEILRDGILNSSFGTDEQPAQVQLGLYNPIQDSVKRKDGGTFSDPPPVYRLPGTPVFIGALEVTGGKFEQKVLIPRNVALKKPGVSLTGYAWYGSDLALGYKGDLFFKGSVVSQITDNEGPRITVRPVYDTTVWDAPVGFTDKISSFLPLECEICVWDEHGIDVSGIGPDEGLNFEIKGVCKENINHKFKFYEGEFTKGHANVVLQSEDNIKAGVYTMTITAQDLLGKVSKRDFDLEILEDQDFKLGHVFNYPNPVRRGQSTRFYFYHSNTSKTKQNNTDVTLKIFTLSGKLIRVFYDVYNGQVWDVKDQRGNPLPPNVYLYRITAKMDNAGLDGSERIVKSPVKKLVVYPH